MLDIKKALTIPFNDKNWQKKIGIAVLLYLPGFVASLQFNEKNIVTSFLYALASFIITGYAILAAHNEAMDEQIILPEWDFLNCIVSSFKLWLVNLGWVFILIPFATLLFLIGAFHSGLLIISVILAMPLIIIYMLVINIAQSLFLDRLELSDAFDFKNIFQIVKNHSGIYLFYIIVFLLLAIVYGIIAGVMTATFSFLISKTFGYYIAYFINIFLLISAFNLLAQVTKIVKKE